jgi:hypothetical protein
MSLADLDLEARLRDQRLRAADAEVPADLPARVRARYRRQQRRRLATAAAVLAVAAVFVGVTRIGQSLLADPAPAAPSTVDTPALYDVPTRGSLAGDRAWVDGVAALDWRFDGAEPAPEGPRPEDVTRASHRVLFAGDVPGGRAAFVAGTAGSATFGAWFVGPAGAAPEELERASSPDFVRDGEPQALWDVPDLAGPPGVLVVLGEPGQRLEFSPGHRAEADGSVGQTWRAISNRDGFGVVVTDPPASFGVRMLVRADGGTPVRAVPSGRATAYEPQAVEPIDPRGLREHADDDPLRQAMDVAAGYFAVPLERLKPVLLWHGPLGAPSPDSGVLVGFTLPSGATTVSLVTYRPYVGSQGGGTSLVVLAAPHPADADVLDQVWAIVGPDTVTVSGPLPGRTAQLLDGGDVVAEIPLEAGAGSGAAPSALWHGAVRVLDGDGRVVAEGAASDPLQ